MNNNKIITSPVATVLWPKLNEPNTKFNESGDYEATIVLNPNDTEHNNFIQMLEEMYVQAIKEMATEHKKPKIKQADSPVRPMVDKEGMETGLYKVKFKLGASGETKDGRKYERKPALFGSDGKPFTAVIGHNSQIKVAFKANAYFVPSVGAGLSLRLEAVQVVQANSGSMSFNDYGFSATSAPAADEIEAPASNASNEDF